VQHIVHVKQPQTKSNFINADISVLTGGKGMTLIPPPVELALASKSGRESGIRELFGRVSSRVHGQKSCGSFLVSITGVQSHVTIGSSRSFDTMKCEPKKIRFIPSRAVLRIVRYSSLAA
jgi:hypothetical protein